MIEHLCFKCIYIHPKTANSITYTKRDRDFTGYIFFTDLYGAFINGYQYNSGKIVRETNPRNTQVSRMALPNDCGTVEVQVWERECYTVGTVDYCTSWQYAYSYNLRFCSGGSTSSSSGTVYNSVGDNRAIIDSLNGYPCAQGVLKEIPNVNLKAQEMINKIFNVSATLNLKFIPDPSLPDQTDGETTCGGSGEFFNCTVRLNPKMLTSATKDFIAATIVHETVHAYINYKRQTLDPATFKQQFPIYAEYIGNNAAHNEMAVNYVSIMAEMLMARNSRLTRSTAEALSWGGLQKTTAWPNYDNQAYVLEINAEGKGGYSTISNGMQACIINPE